jgi:serine acetyltransferase
VFLGAGAVVIDSISVASNVIIGAGGVVVAAIHSPGSYVGVPVRRIADLD